MLRCLSLFLYLVGALSLRAEPLSRAKADALRERFEARQRETRSWSAGLTQTVSLPGLRTPVVSEGTIRFRAPDALRIDFTQPGGEWVLALGDRLFLQKPGKRLAEKSLRGDAAGKPWLALLGLLQGRPAADESAFEAHVTQQEGDYVIVLTKKPDAERALPKRITTTIAAATLEVRAVQVELPRGGTLGYAFREPVRNRPLDADVFALPASR